MAEPLCHRLPTRLLPQDAAALQASLLGLRGRPVTLDAGGVAQLSTPCVQVLLAAARSWREDGLGLALVGPSDEMAAVLDHLAVDPAALQSPEA
ncbi:MAG: STAS domain-containing protein [Amaricoccus sp.]|uniref:STAS domain-containing protein n=1 Tax=Amaricoccus sp. TaxID=1872485 RepID=UPI0039E7009C